MNLTCIELTDQKIPILRAMHLYVHPFEDLDMGDSVVYLKEVQAKWPI